MHRANFFCRSFSKGFPSSFRSTSLIHQSSLYNPQRSYVTKDEISKRKRAMKRKVREEVSKEDPLHTKLHNAALISQMTAFQTTAFPGPVKTKRRRMSEDVPTFNLDIPFEETLPETRKILDLIGKLKYAAGMLEAKFLETANQETTSLLLKDNNPEIALLKLQKIHKKLLELQQNLEQVSESASQADNQKFDVEKFLDQIDQEARQETLEKQSNFSLAEEEQQYLEGDTDDVLASGSDDVDDQDQLIQQSNAVDEDSDGNPRSDGEEPARLRDSRDLLLDEDVQTSENDDADITDVDLESYNLDNGDYIDAQTFLQDVSRFKVNDFPLEKRTKIVDMIEKARKILRLQREDREFWDEFTIIRQLHELTVLNPNHYRPIVNPALKDNMYHLYASNPEEWTVGKLAQKFRMKKVKVEAILRLKIDEYIKARTEPWEVSEEGDEIEEAYAEYFGWVGVDDWSLKELDDRMDVSQPRWRSALVSSVDEEEDLAKLHRLAFRIQEQWDEMPDTRPSGPGSYPAPSRDGEVIRNAQYKYKKRPRGEFIFIDSSPIENFEEQAKMFWLARDGSMRHLTWEERVKVFKRGPFGDDRWTGGLAHLTTLIDPVIFPADAEEEKLLAEQLKPQWKNRRFAQTKVILERDVLKQMDHAYGSLAPHKFKKDSYLYGRIPWSVQEALKQKRSTNVLDTIYKPLQMPPF